MGENCVRNLMAPPDGTIGVDSTVKDLVQSLAATGLGPTEEQPVLLVTGRDGRGLSLLTPLDLFEAIQPPYAKGEWAVEFFWDGLLQQRCRNIAGKRIGDIIKPPVTINATATLGAAVHLFATRKVQVAAVTQNRRIIGVLRASDVFKVITATIRENEVEAVGDEVA